VLESLGRAIHVSLSTLSVALSRVDGGAREARAAFVAGPVFGGDIAEAGKLWVVLGEQRSRWNAFVRWWKIQPRDLGGRENRGARMR